MDAVFSLIRATYLTLRALLAELAASSAEFDALLQRVARPSLPVSNPTVSSWQQNPLHPELVDVQSDILPATADIVIIGSGISGASIAYTILTENETLKKRRLARDLKVIVLEARQLCSGATGRNGGHVKCSPYSDYVQYKARFGPERAAKLLKFELKALPALMELVDRLGIKTAEVRQVETIDIFTDSMEWEKAKQMVHELREDLPDLARETELYEADEGCRKFGVSPAYCHGIVKYPAGALWPYRLVTSLFAWLVSKYPGTFCIETDTVVTSVETQDAIQRPFVVETSRGKIATTHVVHATDAFAANLIPGFKSKLFPVRGHMTTQKPGDRFPHLDGSRSWSIMDKRGYEYITQRPGRYTRSASPAGGELLVGGGVIQSPGRGVDEFGIWRDDHMSAPISAYLDGILPVIFGKDNWGEDVDGSRVRQAWVGCMGFTADLLPYVGKLEPGLTGRKVNTAGCKKVKGAKTISRYQILEPAEWVSAGFNGEGMVLAWLSGVAVGLMVLGREHEHFERRPGMPEGKVVVWLPQEFICTKARVDRSKVTELAMLL